MEKYSDICKFIFVCDQLSKIIEPIRSRCILLRVPLPTNDQLLETLLVISEKEKINVSLSELKDIIINSENKLNHSIWLLELKKYGISYDNIWNKLIDEMAYIILNKSNYNAKKFNSVIKKIREIFYNFVFVNIKKKMKEKGKKF